mmetsp:Transcript_2187/g.4000  ORF Transcript_2187/g.4000 Transcript_2187/m.4000 type:complete len:211 (+) Transcript_2187:208-840(+)
MVWFTYLRFRCIHHIARRVWSSRALSTAKSARSNATAYSYFGKFKITHRDQVFFASKHSLGIVNLKPIVPGHVLVIPKRVKPRLKDLTTDEVTDLYLSVNKIGPILEQHYRATALNIATQDGIDAGQSVPHVHVHILPRRPRDIEPNDKVYDEIENWNSKSDALVSQNKDHNTNKLQVPADEERRARSMEEMASEASELRGLFPENQPDI